jgi:hypothetical protein
VTALCRFTAHGDFMPSSPKLAPNVTFQPHGANLGHQAAPPKICRLPGGDCVVDAALRRLMEIL